ncbi:pyrroloquinoline quinone biosynthesis protein PqqF [Pseudomonas sp. UBA1879]|uniref:pyrroloquinoline quinone biosynthesis protein PqqF n=1 Tax=Pseudomonas sp. UBA1879 TaxID=1947305 RepID=UPI0025D9FA69|nr:pyrroloquinoline quinone biosynthesis protein PqqF [Pseudomonas sp. UBA1879]
MPVPDSTTHRSLTLPNGLRVVLCSAPRLKRCAAALRVAAGSHDVPTQWPGLAHFLEHLFFLGTERFPADQNLMAYVQRHGGQVNASTRERTTDFFFELAPPLFNAGVERLCDMLAHPRLRLADQLREREVLHAEFIAWSRDDGSRDHLKRLQPLSALHPLRGFHAGNRFSLPVPRPAFQRALQDFYQTFYQAGQMTLSLAGPQTLEELQAMATTFGRVFPAGRRVEQQKPPALMHKQAGESPSEDEPRQMHLMFACEGLPQGHEQAAVFLCTWVNNAQPGGLVAQLRERGLIESLKAHVVYAFAGQVLFEIEIALADAIASDSTPTDHLQPPAGVSVLAKTSVQATHIYGLIFNWLTFFKANYPALLDEYERLQQRHMDVSNALALARHYSAGHAPSGVQAEAIDALLDQLTPSHLLYPISPAAINDVTWHLPSPNPFLRESETPETAVSLPPALTVSDALPAIGEATIYLRWTLPSPQPTLHRMLVESLKPLIADAQQAGVTLAFEAYGPYWQLKLSGFADPFPAILEQGLTLLGEPSDESLARYAAPSREPAPIPIRQLLKTLPDHFLNSPVGKESIDLRSIWSNARWTGFAAGFPHNDRGPLALALTRIPGIPEHHSASAALQAADQRWQIETSESSEDAVLMFYPTPTNSIEDEAAWRFFSHLTQAPFYQRLRVELQLGYAVFSGFRQIAGHGGMLFGVQSPSVSASQLVEHIKTFMNTLPAQIETADVPAQLLALQNQLDPAVMDFQTSAEMLWQAHLAGHGADYVARLQHSFAHLHREDILDAAKRVALSCTPLLCLSNRAGPGR